MSNNEPVAASPGAPVVPLSVLDLVPITEGGDARRAVAETIDLARRTEQAGYARYWVAEHHLNPGVAGSSPAVVLALLAAHTSRIRLGSGAVLAGNQSALALVEQFGLLDAAAPGRIDLGLGRSASRGPAEQNGADKNGADKGGLDKGGADESAAPKRPDRAPNGLPLPPGPPGLFALLGSRPRVAAQGDLLRGGREAQPYGEQLEDLLALLEDRYADREGGLLAATPHAGPDQEIWVMGSSGGESAQLAGALGLAFGANYHVTPGNVLEAVEAYRAAFRPSPRNAAPRVAVSADVVVAETPERAAELARGFGHWVRSIRCGDGAIAYPSPERAAELPWTAEDDALVADRIASRFVGTPEQVTAGLRLLAEATGADDLVITTITHDHEARVRSYELLAEHWARHGTPVLAAAGQP